MSGWKTARPLQTARTVETKLLFPLAHACAETLSGDDCRIFPMQTFLGSIR